MPGRRKLFIAHASELAYRCVRSLQRDGLVAEFVRSYIARYNRPGLSTSPERIREFDSAIGREALLVMTAKVQRMLPAAFAAKNNRPTPEEASLSAAFYAEFLASLGRSLEWSPSEAAAESNAFGRDLEMYQRWSGRSPVRFAAKSKGDPAPAAVGAYAGMGAVAGGPVESPFADRCALLLDPEMMEQARRASAEFEVAIARAAASMFSQLGRGPAPTRRSSRTVKPRRPRVRKQNARPRRRPSQKKPASPRGKKSRSARKVLARFHRAGHRPNQPGKPSKRPHQGRLKKDVKRRAK